MKNLALAQTWASGDSQPLAKISILGYTYALKPGGVIPPLVLAILTLFWTNSAYLQFLTSHLTVLGYVSLKYSDATSPPVWPIIIKIFKYYMLYITE